MKIYCRSSSKSKTYTIRREDILGDSTKSIKVACGESGKFPQRFAIYLPKSLINLQTGKHYRFTVPGWLRDEKCVGDNSLDDIIQTF